MNAAPSLQLWFWEDKKELFNKKEGNGRTPWTWGWGLTKFCGFER